MLWGEAEVPATREALRPKGVPAEPSGSPYVKLPPGPAGPGRSRSWVADHQRGRVHAALVELVARCGYDGVTVRRLAATAGISTATFYKHFADKAACFDRSRELVLQEMLKRMVLADQAASDPATRVGSVFRALAAEVSENPDAVSLVLIEADRETGPTAVERAHRVERAFGAWIAEAFAGEPGGIVMPPQVVRAIVAGAMGVARTHLLGGETSEPDGAGERLAEWALSYRHPAVLRLAELDFGSSSAVAPATSSGVGGEMGRGMEPPTGHAALLLAVVAKLAAAGGYESLDLRDVLKTAGVSRKNFAGCFRDVDACLVAALDLHGRQAIAQAKAARRADATWTTNACRSLVALCGQVAGDPVLARLCFAVAAPPGAEGVRWRQRFAANIATLLTEEAPPSCRLEGVAAEAMAGAVWGALRDEVIAGGVRQAPSLAGVLSYLALAPAIGAANALEVIEGETGPTGGS
jgi:AcrR family transcriptional regulator